MYKESCYNFKEEFDKEMMLYNSKTGAVAVVDEDNLEKVKSLLDNPNQEKDNELLGILLSQGFVVDEERDEFEEVKAKYNKSFNDKSTVTIVMLPAEFCNLACPYCFIYNYADKAMDDSVYENVKKYIRNRIEEYDDDKKMNILVTWFGGEPLLARDKINEFMAELKDEFEALCNLQSSIVTNGYYLDYDTFEKLYNNNLYVYQITFDGAKESHDVTRVRKDEQGGSYDVLINNLKDIRKNVTDDMDFNFAIRINFMKNTYKGVYDLIDELAEIIDGDRRFYIYCRPVYNFETQRETINEIEDDIFTIEEGLLEQTRFTLYIQEKTNGKKEVRSISDYLPMPTSRWCSEDNRSSIIVASDGGIYYCDTLIGDEKFCIGRLKDDGEVEYNDKSIEWRKGLFEYENVERCSKCKCLPTCMGSCKRERVFVGNDTPCLYKEEDIYNYMKIYYDNEYKNCK